MASLRHIANCIGIDTSKSMSVLSTFLGFINGKVPEDPRQTAVSRVSLLEQARLLQPPRKHFHVNIIKVGEDLHPLDRSNLDYCIYRAREIFATVYVGIGRVEYYQITASEAKGLDRIEDGWDAADLVDGFYVDNDGLDVFIPDIVATSDFEGMACPGDYWEYFLSEWWGTPEGGPCDKSDWGSGMIVDKNRDDADALARTFAHEIGHYLGLKHQNDDPNRLMCQTKDAGVARLSVVLSSWEGTHIQEHCSMHHGC